MTIFVQRASECLTDHRPHGDGLICYSLLRGLVDRGHRVFAYTNDPSVSSPVNGLTVRGGRHRVPANSLADWEHAWRADRWLGEIACRERVDLVWRMHPYETGCPTVPRTGGRPLVVGPLFYGWPADAPRPVGQGRPRFGIGLTPLLEPIARRGWDRTLRAAQLVLCATDAHSEQVRARTAAQVETLPVIVDPPAGLEHASPSSAGGVRLVFVANLVANKRPEVFCETVAALRRQGIAATAIILGDGPERPALEAWCQTQGLGSDVVRFVGRVPNGEVFHHLAAADLLVSTSYGEPYGRNIVEAMSVGTPAECHRSGGPADIIADGVDGALVDSLDPGAFASRIAELVRWNRLPAMSDAALTKAADWRSDHIIGRLETLLLSLLERPT